MRSYIHDPSDIQPRAISTACGSGGAAVLRAAVSAALVAGLASGCLGDPGSSEDLESLDETTRESALLMSDGTTTECAAPLPATPPYCLGRELGYTQWTYANDYFSAYCAPIVGCFECCVEDLTYQYCPAGESSCTHVLCGEELEIRDQCLIEPGYPICYKPFL